MGMIGVIILVVVLGSFGGSIGGGGDHQSGQEETKKATAKAENVSPTQEQSKALAVAFITALGDRNFSQAYEMHTIGQWQPFSRFSSEQFFGGIVETRLLQAPKVTCLNNSCTRTKIFLKYLSVDPVNDGGCNKGRVFEQLFWVDQRQSQWNITRAKLAKRAYCYHGG